MPGSSSPPSDPPGGEPPAPPWAERTALLLGPAALARLARTRVILFGTGGVGSWCAEALVRTGIGHLTLVDSDVIAPSNLNRQLQALHHTVGTVKVEALRQRLLAIRPDADVQTVQRVYQRETKDSFGLPTYDYVLDAIDSLSNKVGLIQHASELGCTVFSSMGASQKLDPTRVRVASLWKTDQDRLARFVRKRLRRRGFQGDLLCVYSDERAAPLQGDEPPPPVDEDAPDPGFGKLQVNGSVMHVPATFGLVLASLVINDVARRAAEPPPQG